MSNTFTEAWLQDVAVMSRLPALNPSVAKLANAAVETQLRIIIQQANSFQRKGKAPELKVDHVNLALKKHRIEPLYGVRGKHDSGETHIDLEEAAKHFSEMAVPIKPSLGVHWLAVNGIQPAIPENPVLLSDKAQPELKVLPREFQNLYARVVAVLLSSSDPKALETVQHILANDKCLQPLVPLFSRFFYQQIKSGCKSQSATHLTALLRSLTSLQRNSNATLEAHLTQLLPAVFTLVAAPALSNEPSSGQWSLRREAAALVAHIVARYGDSFTDLYARVCRTYLDAISLDTTQSISSAQLCTLYGGIVGLEALGVATVQSLLVPALPGLRPLLAESLPKSEDAMEEVDNFESQVDVGGKRKRSAGSPFVEHHPSEELLQCRDAVRQALGGLIEHKLRQQRGTFLRNNFTSEPEFCDLEESLAVYFTARNADIVPHAFLSL